MPMQTLKLAFRKLRRDKLYSVVNITGLSVGLAVCLLIVLFIQEELSYDRFHRNADRIALFQQFENSAGSGSGFRNLLNKNIAGVEEATRLLPAKAVVANKASNQAFYETNFYFADSNFFDVFDVKFLAKQNAKPFAALSSVVISEKAAHKYFGNETALGKTLLFNNKKPLTVAGVFEDFPSNSHIAIDFLTPFSNAIEATGQKLDGYWDGSSLTYILAAHGTSASQLQKSLPALVKSLRDPNAGVWKPAFIPLRDIYLKASLDARVKAPKAITAVYVFSVISLLVLLLACFNYINLASARMVFKSKEIGVRKIIGASKLQIAVQHLQESALPVFIAAVAGLLLALAAIPFFNHIAGTFLNAAQLSQPQFLFAYAAAVVFLSLLTGFVPAFTLASLKPLGTAKQLLSKGKTSYVLRKVLVTAQFAVSIAIVIAVLVVSKQLSYVQNRDLGYSRKQVLTLNYPADAKVESKQYFKEQLKALSAVEEASIGSQLPGQGAGINKLVETYLPAGGDLAYSALNVDKDFLKLFNIKLLQGTDFFPTSRPENKEFIINATMAERLQLKSNAVGKPLAYYTYQYTPDGGYKEVAVTGKIIGVVADYNQSDLKSQITPLLIQLNQGWEGALAVKLKAGNIKAGVATVEELWKKSFSDKPFEYDFLDNAFNLTYKKDVTTGKALSFFSILAVFISCLGLIGLTAISVERKSKELSIRKVLGASVMGIARLLTGDFVKLILLAFVVASPVAWWGVQKWLQEFAYRTTVSWWVFAAAGVATLLLALLTISFQAIKTAVANPVKNLRAE